MEVKITIPEYSPERGLELSWVEDGEITVIRHSDTEIEILANKEGLITLATQFLTLAQENVRSTHYHLTHGSGLEDDSVDLIVSKK